MKKHSGKTSIPVGLTAAMLASSLVGGCTLGPDYERPPISVPTTFRAQLTPTEAASFADLPWWSAFNDPTLQSLISEAVVNNYEVQIAVARIEQARAALGVVSSESVPQLNYGAGVGGGRGLVQSQDSVSAVTAGTITGGLNAAWEIDLWGRIRRSTEAARANLLAQEDVRQGVMLSLVTDVANGYSRLLELDRELAIANESTRAFKGSFDLFTARFAAGRDSKLSVHRSQANYDESRARAADLKRQIAQQENALSILLGSYPKSIPRGRGLAEQTLPATPLGASSDLLQRRPDILAAEENMIAANAEIGVAIANFFPRIGLSAFVGGEGLRIAGTNSAFGLWSAGLAATGPIFNGGRLKSEYEGRQAFWDESVAQYRKTVLTAFQETSDALAAQQNLVDRRAALEAQVTDLKNSVDLALLRYDGGRATYFEVLEAQQQLFPAQDALAQTQRDQLVAVVNLYKALGGGWKLAPEEWKQARH
jgi:outer membrane protein, multidrug efflux system